MYNYHGGKLVQRGPNPLSSHITVRLRSSRNIVYLVYFFFAIHFFIFYASRVRSNRFTCCPWALYMMMNRRHLATLTAGGHLVTFLGHSKRMTARRPLNPVPMQRLNRPNDICSKNSPFIEIRRIFNFTMASTFFCHRRRYNKKR